MPAKTIPDFGFCGPTYQAASQVLDSERCINLYPEPGGPNSKSKMAMIGTPGLKLLTSGLAGNVRALWAGNGRLFAIAANHGYEISPLTGAVLTDYGTMAGDSGIGYNPCKIVANNGGSAGGALYVVNSNTAQIYNFNPAGPSMDSVFNATAMEYLDGFQVAIAFGASLAGGNANQVNVSDLGNGNSWGALNYIIRTGAPDLITQLAVVNEQLWIFGQKTIEIWYNAGNPLFPFQRYQGATIDCGLLAPWTVAKAAGTLLWLGSDDRGYARVYKANGFMPEPVSNFAIESMIQSFIATFGISFNTNAFVHSMAGHTFYCLNMQAPTAANSMTLVYDLQTGLWHERYSNNALGAFTQWLPNCFASINSTQGSGPAGLDFVGDYSSGKIYQIGAQFTSENGVAMIRQRNCPHISNSNRWVSHASLEIDADIGTAAIALAYSNDGGRSFPHTRAAISASNDKAYNSGDSGFGRFKFWQLGRSRDRVYSAKIVDANNPIRIINAYLAADEGTEP